MHVNDEPEPTPAERLAVMISELQEDVEELRRRLDGRKLSDVDVEVARKDRAERWKRTLAIVQAALGQRGRG
jgi:hypothetical protein